MTEYLPLTTESAADRSHLEAQLRGAGLPGMGTQYYHPWITNPLTGQEALVIPNEEYKAFLTPAEVSSLLSREAAEAADWFVSFDEEL